MEDIIKSIYESRNTTIIALQIKQLRRVCDCYELDDSALQIFEYVLQTYRDDAYIMFETFYTLSELYDNGAQIYTLDQSAILDLLCTYDDEPVQCAVLHFLKSYMIVGFDKQPLQRLFQFIHDNISTCSIVLQYYLLEAGLALIGNMSDLQRQDLYDFI